MHPAVRGGVKLLLALLSVCHVGVTCVTCAAHAQYAAVIDAGSSGSRIRIYQWQPTGNRYVLPDIREVYNYKIQPGISSYVNSLHMLQDYISQLIDKGKQNVPPQQHNTTSIYCMATAGMRLLLEDHANQVIDKIDSILDKPEVNPFSYQSGNTRILSGEEEGVFAWITINYLRGFFLASAAGVELESSGGTLRSAGVLELGGASTQIVFMPEGSVLADKFPVKIAGWNYPLYVHSYLHYGQNYAEKWVNDYIVTTSRDPTRTQYENPCYPVDAVGGATANVTFTGTGDTKECLDILNHLVYKAPNFRCFPKPCAIGSVYQPSISEDHEFIATSAFLFVLESIEAIYPNGTFVPAEMARAAEVFCAKNISILEEELDRHGDSFLLTECLMGQYLPLLLTKGYGFSNNTTQLSAIKKINGQPTEWTLGAIIYEKERRDWKCAAVTAAVSGGKTVFVLVEYVSTVTSSLCCLLVLFLNRA